MVFLCAVYEVLLEAGYWTGGYVHGLGYVAGAVTITGAGNGDTGSIGAGHYCTCGFSPDSCMCGIGGGSGTDPGYYGDGDYDDNSPYLPDFGGGGSNGNSATDDNPPYKEVDPQSRCFFDILAKMFGSTAEEYYNDFTAKGYDYSNKEGISSEDALKYLKESCQANIMYNDSLAWQEDPPFKTMNAVYDSGVEMMVTIYVYDSWGRTKLKVSKRTLQDYRTTGKIPYIQLGGKVLYRESDIQKMLEMNYRKAWQ